MSACPVPQPSGAIPDAELVRRSLAGEVELFEVLVHRYHDWILGLLLRITRDGRVADELEKNVWYNAWTHLGQFDCRRPFRPWVHRIASNLAMSFYRRPKLLVQLDESDENEPEAPEVSCPGPADEREAQWQERAEDAQEQVRRAWLPGALAGLDPDERDILRRRFELDQTLAEISDETRRNLNTVKSMSRRVLARLRRKAWPECTQNPCSA